MFKALKDVWILERVAVGSVAEGKQDSTAKQVFNWVLSDPTLNAPFGGGAKLPLLLDKAKFVASHRIGSLDIVVGMNQSSFNKLSWPQLLAVKDHFSWLTKVVSERRSQLDSLKVG